jgi:hypothetical protein
MKKQEITQLHLLFDLIKKHFEQKEVNSAEFDYDKLPNEIQNEIDISYSELGIKSTDVHKSKNKQQEAMMTLVNQLSIVIKHSDELTSKEENNVQRNIQEIRSLQSDD